MTSNKEEPMKRSGYNSMGETRHENTASATGDDSNGADSKEMVEPKYRVVVVGQAGCGKSTVCNLLLNEDKFPRKIGFVKPSSQFQSEVNKRYELKIIDTCDAFSQGYTTDITAKWGFRKKLGEQMTQRATIPTGFLFPIPVSASFTPGDYTVCQKYIKLFSKYPENRILVLTDMQNTELSQEEGKESSLHDLIINGFQGRVVNVSGLPLSNEKKEKFIDDIMGHVRDMPYAGPPSQFGVLEDIGAFLLLCLKFVGRQVVRLVRWVCRKCCCGLCCPRCKCFGYCCCLRDRNERTKLNSRPPSCP